MSHNPPNLLVKAHSYLQFLSALPGRFLKLGMGAGQPLLPCHRVKYHSAAGLSI
jgi:hypothetical protein